MIRILGDLLRRRSPAVPPAVEAGRAIIADGERDREAALGRAVLDAAHRANLHHEDVWVDAWAYGCPIVVRGTALRRS